MKKHRMIGSGIGGISIALVAVLILGLPKPVAAGIPVFDAANEIQNGLTYVEETISAVQQYASTFQEYYEWAMSFELAGLKVNLTQGLTDKVLGYVNGGSGGDAKKFVTDWKAYAQDARAKAESSVTKAIANTDVCDSFRTPLLTAIGETNQPENPPNKGPLSCDFDAGKLQQIAADPSKGSWADYQKTFKPQNNFYGAYTKALEQKRKAAEKAEKAATDEAIAGAGYLGAKSADGTITTPGSTLKGMLDAAVNADYAVIANADQLQNIIGSLSGSVINKIAQSGGSDSDGKPKGDKGFGGVDLKERQRQRNITRDSMGNIIKGSDVVPNCTEIFAESLTKDQFALFDTSPTNGYLDADEISLGILSYGDEVESGLYDLCLSNSTAASGNQQFSVDATIKEVITKRKEAQKPLQKLITQVKTTEKALDSYDTNGKWVKGKHKYAIDNPDYDSSLPNTGTCPDGTLRSQVVGGVVVTNCSAVNRFKYLFLDGSIAVPQSDGSTITPSSDGKVNIRKCFEIDYDTARYENAKGKGAKNDYASVGFRYIREAHPTDSNVRYFKPGVTATSNPASDFKSTRCTVASYIDPNEDPLSPTDCSITSSGMPANSQCKLIEMVYYNKVIAEVQRVVDANNLAVRKLNAYQKMIEVASKLKSKTGANEKIAELITDFRCHAGVFACTIPDPDQPGAMKYPEPQLQNRTPTNADADTDLNEAGYYKTDPSDDSLILDSSGNPIFVHVPDHRFVLDSEYAASGENSSSREDNYKLMLQRIGLVGVAGSSVDCFTDPRSNPTDFNCIAQRGLITTINQDNDDDDPSNPYYEPAFDLNEATRVYEFSQGNLEILGDLQPTDENDVAEADPQLNNGETPAP